MDGLKIGILVPRSRQFPELGFQFTAGLRDVFSKYPLAKHELFIEDVGVEAGKNVVMEKSQKLLLQYQSDLVVAFVGNQVTTELSNFFDSLGKILVITNMGANNIVHPASPYVFDHSMGLYGACREMGHYMARNGKKRIVVASSFYDSGYGLYAAFLEGVKAGKGEVARLVFTGDVPNGTELLSIGQLVRQLGADALYAIYCGNTASHFLDRYFSNPFLKTFPLYGSPFLLPAKSEALSGYDYTIATPFWGGLAKRPFYIQGTEVALLLAQAFGGGKSNVATVDRMKGGLESAKIGSPRGTVEVDAGLHATMAPVYLTQYADGLPVETTVLQQQASAGPTVARGNMLSGFINPYLCM